MANFIKIYNFIYPLNLLQVSCRYRRFVFFYKKKLILLEPKPYCRLNKMPSIQHYLAWNWNPWNKTKDWDSEKLENNEQHAVTMNANSTREEKKSCFAFICFASITHINIISWSCGARSLGCIFTAFFYYTFFALTSLARSHLQLHWFNLLKLLVNFKGANKLSRIAESNSA